MESRRWANIFVFFLIAGCVTFTCKSYKDYEALGRAINPYGFGYFYQYDYPFGYANQFRNEHRQGLRHRDLSESQKRYWYNFGSDKLQVYRPTDGYRHMHPQKNYGEQPFSTDLRNRFSPGNLMNSRPFSRPGR